MMMMEDDDDEEEGGAYSSPSILVDDPYDDQAHLIDDDEISVRYAGRKWGRNGNGKGDGGVYLSPPPNISSCPALHIYSLR